MDQQTKVTNVNEVSLKEVFFRVNNLRRYILSKWLVVAIVSVLGGIVGFTYAYLKKAQYIAECTFVMEEGGKGGLGQYAGLASIAGLDVGGGSGLFQGDNILELYKSYVMIRKTLLTPVNYNGKQVLLIDKYIELNKWREQWQKQPRLKSISFTVPQSQFTLQHDSILKSFVADINKNYLTVDRPNKKLTIISVRVKSKDQFFSKLFTDNIVQNVNSFYVQTKAKNATNNVIILQHQADSVRRVLNSSITGVAAAIDATPNPNPSLQVLRAPSQRKQVDVMASQAVYAQVVQNLELARIALRRELPLIQVIDEPILPLNVIKPSVLIYSIAGFAACLFLTVMVLVVAKFIKVINRD